MLTKSQIFKKKMDESVVKELIQSNFTYDTLHNEYVSNMITFKRMLYSGTLRQFQTYIRPFYFSSKQNYPENILSYRGFHVVLRQLSKYFGIPYRYQIKYFHSNYVIEYYIKLD